MALLDDLGLNNNPLPQLPGLPPISGAMAPQPPGLPPIGQQANLNPMPALPMQANAPTNGLFRPTMTPNLGMPPGSPFSPNALSGVADNKLPAMPNVFGSNPYVSTPDPMTALRLRMTDAASKLAETHQGLTHLPQGKDWKHESFWQRLGRVGEGIGNVAGDVFAPSTMMLIPGTQLNREITAKEGQEQLAGIQKGETDSAEAAAREATAKAELAKANGGELKPLEGLDLSYPDPNDPTKTITYPAAYGGAGGATLVPMLPSGAIAPTGTPTVVPRRTAAAGTRTPLEQAQQSLLDELNGTNDPVKLQTLFQHVADLDHITLIPGRTSPPIIDATHPKGVTYPLGHTENGMLVAVTPTGPQAVPAPAATATHATSHTKTATNPAGAAGAAARPAPVVPAPIPVKPNPPNAGITMGDFGGGLPVVPGLSPINPPNLQDTGFRNPVASLFGPKAGLPQIGGPLPLMAAAGQQGYGTSTGTPSEGIEARRLADEEKKQSDEERQAGLVQGPDRDALIDEIGQGKINLGRLAYIAARNPLLLQDVTKKYGDFDSSKVESYTKLIENFTSGPISTQLNAAGAVLPHLLELYGMNTDESHIPGTPDWNAYHNKLDTVSSELARFYGDETIPAIEKISRTLGSNMPGTRQAAIKTQIQSMGDKLNAYRQQWKNGAPSKAYHPAMPDITPEAWRALVTLDPQNVGLPDEWRVPKGADKIGRNGDKEIVGYMLNGQWHDIPEKEK